MHKKIVRFVDSKKRFIFFDLIDLQSSAKPIFVTSP